MARKTWLLALVIIAAFGLMMATAAAQEDNTPAKQPDSDKVTLDSRLLGLQEALEAFTAKNWRTMPRDINGLADFLEEGVDDMLNPETGERIVMNKAMSGQDERSIRTPAKFITFYADAETPGKGRAAIYATREIKYLNAKDFKKALAESVVKRLTAEERIALRAAYQDQMREARAARRARNNRRGQ